MLRAEERRAARGRAAGRAALAVLCIAIAACGEPPTEPPPEPELVHIFVDRTYWAGDFGSGDGKVIAFPDTAVVDGQGQPVPYRLTVGTLDPWPKNTTGKVVVVEADRRLVWAGLGRAKVLVVLSSGDTLAHGEATATHPDREGIALRVTFYH